MTMNSRLLATSVAALLLVGATACQGQSQPAATNAPATTGQTTSATTAPATTSAGDKNATTSKPAAGEPTSAVDLADKMQAALQEAKTNKLVMTTTGKVADKELKSVTTILSDLSDPAKQKAKSTIEMDGQKLESIIIGTDMWTNMGTGRWTKSTVTAEEAKAGMDMSKAQLAKAQDFKKVGKESVDGTDTTHYQAAIKDTGGTNTLDYWLDAKNRMVKFSTTVDTGAGTPVVSVGTVTDFGKAVSIEAPDPSLVDG